MSETDQIEQRMYRDDFELMLRRQGWHMIHCKPVYTDPNVILVRKPRHPLSIERGPAAWHGLLLDNTFRKLLRALINGNRTTEELSKMCGDSSKLQGYLHWLREADIIAQEGDGWIRGPACHKVDNTGRTFEWCVAEWFRAVLHVPARHGVGIKEVPRGGGPRRRGIRERHTSHG